MHDTMTMTQLAEKLRAIVGTESLREREPMSAHTTFKVGGPARLYVTPRSPQELRAVLMACREEDVPRFVLGCGSDLLVADDGYLGVIVSLTEGLARMEASGERIVCGAGVSLKDLCEKACELGLSGLEFACGIPGSVGGACFMNAGAYGGCTADVLESVRAYTPEGEEVELLVDDLAMGYRKSRVRDDGLVVYEATFVLAPGTPSEIRATMDDLTAQRTTKQPLEYGSAGSTFKRPEGYFAGKLIMDAGLKGYRVGDAAVSTKHAGFVVNLGSASAADVHAVIEHVQAEVQRQFGVHLEPEVRFLP